MANRYNQPQAGQFMNTYVAPPLELMHQALAQKQHQYDVKKAEATEFNDQLTGLQVTGAYAGAYLQGVQQQFGAVLQELDGQDLLDPRNQKKLDGAIRQIGGDKELQSHLQAHKYVKEWKANRDKLMGENALVQANTYEYEKALQEYSATGKLDDRLGQTTIHKGVDRYGELKKFYDQLTANGRESIAYLEDGHAFKVGYKGIDAKRIMTATDEVLGVALASPVGQELLREAKMYGLDEEESVAYVKQNLLNVGAQKIYSQTTTNADVALRASKKAKAEKEMFGGMPGLTERQRGVVDGKVSKHIEFDESGKALPKGADLSTKISAAFSGFLQDLVDNGKALANGDVEGFFKSFSGKNPMIQAYQTAKSPEEKENILEATSLNMVAGINGMSAKELYERQQREFHMPTQNFSTAKQKKEMESLLFGSVGLASLDQFPVYSQGRTDNAATIISEKVNELYPDLDTTPENVWATIQKEKIPYDLTGKVDADNPISPFMLNLQIGTEQVFVDITAGGNKNQIKRLKEAGYMTAKDETNYKNSSITHFGYLRNGVVTKDGKLQLELYHLDPKGDDGMSTSHIPLEQ